MNVETKKIHLNPDQKRREEQIKNYEYFGWEMTEEKVHSGRSTYHVMIRNKDIPHYFEIVELETKYFNLLAKKKYYKPMVEDVGDVIILICLFLMLVIPFVLYVTFKSLRKKSINNYNADLQRQMDDLAKKSQELLNSK